MNSKRTVLHVANESTNDLFCPFVASDKVTEYMKQLADWASDGTDFLEKYIGELHVNAFGQDYHVDSEVPEIALRNLLIVSELCDRDIKGYTKGSYSTAWAWATEIAHEMLDMLREDAQALYERFVENSGPLPPLFQIDQGRVQAFLHHLSYDMQIDVPARFNAFFSQELSFRELYEVAPTLAERPDGIEAHWLIIGVYSNPRKVLAASRSGQLWKVEPNMPLPPVKAGDILWAIPEQRNADTEPPLQQWVEDDINLPSAKWNDVDYIAFAGRNDPEWTAKQMARIEASK